MSALCRLSRKPALRHQHFSLLKFFFNYSGIATFRLLYRIACCSRSSGTRGSRHTTADTSCDRTLEALTYATSCHHNRSRFEDISTATPGSACSPAPSSHSPKCANRFHEPLTSKGVHDCNPHPSTFVPGKNILAKCLPPPVPCSGCVTKSFNGVPM